MKLKYKILWIEDNPKSIRRDKTKIIEYINDLGFECVNNEDIILVNSFRQFEYEIGYEKTADFDLLLVDLDLGKKPSKDEGEDIIRKIRDPEIDVYSEIVFYSSQYEELNKKLNNNFVEGIFTSSREELADKVEKIIDVTIKKVQDVNNLRGLIMAEVAELERIKERIIISASPKISEKHVEKYVLKKIKSSGNSNKNKAERLLLDIDNVLFQDLFQNIGFIDLDKKLHATGEILHKLNITKPISKEALIEPYKQNIRDIRNKFAHIEECDGVDENGIACKIIGDIPFTEENCINIRKEIKRYKRILTEIEQQI